MENLNVHNPLITMDCPYLKWMWFCVKAEEAAISSLKRVLDALDTHLTSNTLLVGNSVTLAIVTMCNLGICFTQLMTKSFIPEFPYVERYFWTMVNQPNFKKVLGEVKQISLFPVTKKHLNQKNLLNQSLRMNPKKRNQQSPNQNLVRKRRLQSPNLRILLIYCPHVIWYWNLDEWKRLY